mmetsp:Transcript_31474/g.106674  ORF Transcript_31474/g.106674 Transcript_31474/m.106674 type:complete len:435 (-) Transcript_31474:24-1328(-)
MGGAKRNAKGPRAKKGNAKLDMQLTLIEPLPSWKGGDLYVGRALDRTLFGVRVPAQDVLCEGEVITSFPKPKRWSSALNILTAIPGQIKSQLLDAQLFVEYSAGAVNRREYDEAGHTVLHQAAAFGLTELCELLLDAGADPDVLGGRVVLDAAGRPAGYSALYMTASCVCQRFDDGRSCRVADVKDKLETIKLLIARGADVDRTQIRGHTPLNMVIQELAGDHRESGYGERETVEGRQTACLMMAHMLVKGSADVNVRPEGANTTLGVAVVIGSPALVLLLVQHGARVNEMSSDMAPLHLVNSIADPKNACLCAKILLEHGADPLLPCGPDYAQSLLQFTDRDHFPRRFPTSMCLSLMIGCKHEELIALLAEQERVERAWKRRTCACCGDYRELFTHPYQACAHCGTRYCSRGCQKIDWKAGHRDVCDEIERNS